MSDWPEHDKLASVHEQSQKCGEFLEWLLDEKGIVLCRYEQTGGTWNGQPISRLAFVVLPHLQDWLAEFFGIDREKLEDEKRRMLDVMRQVDEQIGASR